MRVLAMVCGHFPIGSRTEYWSWTCALRDAELRHASHCTHPEAQNYRFFSSSPPHSSFFHPLSGGMFTEKCWCPYRPRCTPQVCHSTASAHFVAWFSCASAGAAPVLTFTPTFLKAGASCESPNVHFRGPGLQKHQNSTRRPPERESV